MSFFNNTLKISLSGFGGLNNFSSIFVGSLNFYFFFNNRNFFFNHYFLSGDSLNFFNYCLSGYSLSFFSVNYSCDNLVAKQIVFLNSETSLTLKLV